MSVIETNLFVSHSLACFRSSFI